MRVALIGGSFDPIHNGHLAMARYVLFKHLAQQVWFIVSYVTPLKQRKLTSFDHRCAMVEAAIAYDPRMKVCTIEAQRKGTSYTIDTVRELKRCYPKDSFLWLLGNDQAVQLDAWKEIDALSKKIEFYVFPRNQEAIQCAYPHRKMPMELMDISSSEIRNGHKLWQLPKAVAHYISAHALYVETFAKANMSERRFLHSQSVASLCITLAKAHHIDVIKAYCAGMLHDICKEWPKERLYDYLKQLDPQKLQEAAPIWHGYAGAYYVSKTYGIHDREITQAIYHHVKGSRVSALAMIVYISDKLDPSRGYDSSMTIDLCKQDLFAGYQEVQSQQHAYLKQEGKNTNE